MASAPLHLAGRMLPVVIVVAGWQALYPLGLVNAELLPSPISIGAAVVDLAASGDLQENLFVSLQTAFLGLALGLVLGVPIGLAMAVSAAADGFLSPIVKATYSMPKSAIIPLFVLFFGVGGLTNVLATMLTCLLPIVIYAHHGVQSVPSRFVWSARAMGLSGWRLFRRVHLPAAQGAILTGTRISLGLSFIITLAAEMIMSNRGVGKMIFQFGDSGAYPHMFAAIFAFLLAAFVADRLLVLVSGWMLRWQEGSVAHV